MGFYFLARSPSELPRALSSAGRISFSGSWTSQGTGNVAHHVRKCIEYLQRNKVPRSTPEAFFSSVCCMFPISRQEAHLSRILFFCFCGAVPRDVCALGKQAVGGACEGRHFSPNRF